MQVFRSSCCRLGRILLVAALICSVVASSTVGEALVLHQHGVRRAHFHLLGHSDLLSNAAESPTFGHASRPESAVQFAPQRVRTFAIVSTGSVFVSTSRCASIDEARLVSPHSCPLVSIVRMPEAPAIVSTALRCLVWVGRTASAVLLLRNHTLLI